MKALAVMGPMLGSVIRRFATGSSHDDPRKLMVGRRELVVEHFDNATQRQKRRRHGCRKLEGGEPIEKGLGAAAANRESPAPRVTARVSEIARVRLSVNSRRTFSAICTVRCAADRRCAAR